VKKALADITVQCQNCTIRASGSAPSYTTAA